MLYNLIVSVAMPPTEPTEWDAWLSAEQERIGRTVAALAPGGSICWQVAYEVGARPLHLILGPIFRRYGLEMRNRIIWTYGTDAPRAGEGIDVAEESFRALLWFTRSGEYTFNLDPVRIPQRYKSKRHFKGPNKGKLSCNPMGKNPGDVWYVNPAERNDDYPFPPSIVRNLVLSLTNPGDTVAVEEPTVHDPISLWSVISHYGRALIAGLPEGPAAPMQPADPVWNLPVGSRRLRQAQLKFEALRAAKVSRDPLIQYRYTPDGAPYTLFHGDGVDLLDDIPDGKVHQFITSPPYNIGLSQYNDKERPLAVYRDDIGAMIEKSVQKMSRNGVYCFQVGNYASDDGAIVPLDELFHQVFTSLGLVLKTQYIWYFRHGLHCSKRFSGRHEVINVYARPGTEVPYDPSLVPEGRGLIWDIPNVSANHPEKNHAGHPCQFPLELVERLVVAWSNPGDLVADTYMGVGGVLVGSYFRDRPAAGSDTEERFVNETERRLKAARDGVLPRRPMGRRIGQTAQEYEREMLEAS